MEKTGDKYKTLLSSLILVIYAVVVGFFIGVRIGVPRGIDLYGHMSKVYFILNNFPHVRWNNLWYFGTPFLRWYAPLPYYLVSLATVFFGSIDTSITFISLSCFCLTLIGIYMFMFELTDTHLISLIISLLTAAAPGFWNHIYYGLIPRTIATTVLPFSLYFSLKLIKNIENKRRSERKFFVVLILFISFSLLGHLLVGVASLISCSLFMFFYMGGLRRKIVNTAKIFFLPIILSSFFYIPFMNKPYSHFFGYVPHQIYHPITFFLPLTKSFSPLSPLSMPFLVILFLFSLYKKRLFKINKLNFNVLLVLIILNIFLFINALIYYIPNFPWYINGVTGPWVSIYFSSIFLPLIIGILLKENISTFQAHSNKLLLILILIILGLSLVSFPFQRNFEPTSYPTQRLLKIDDDNWTHRLGTDTDSVSIWFNYYYTVPQSRGYYAQGLVYPDWIFWFENAIWKFEDNFNETKYLLDWFAIKWFVVTFPHCNIQKFMDKPNFYRIIAADENMDVYEFIYKDATPLLVATNTTELLIIGNEAAYDNVFRSFAYSDYNSRSIIPNRGKEYIDDYSLEELRSFDAVMLYGYNFHNRAEAYRLLTEYVEKGGALIIDTGYSPESSSSDILVPNPVEKTLATDFGTNWNFTYIDSSITEEIDFSGFSPAVYGVSYPWGVSASFNESIRAWARTVVWNHGQPIVAIGEYGMGRVVWSGLNLPYHITTYKNYWESLLLSKMIEYASQATGEKQPDVNYTVSRPHPEKVIVTVQEVARGVLLKECYFANWYAYLTDGNGQKRGLRIYRAGPDFMYVQIPKDVDFPIEVVFEYGWTSDEIAGYAISLATFIGLMMYAAGLPVDKPARALFLNPLLWVEKRIRSWWK